VGAQNGKRTIALGEYTCAMNAELFELWFKEFLMKEIPWRKTIILDRASFHREAELQKLAKAKRCKIIFLPAYSPDLNPIEKVWANMKKWLRNNMLNFASLSSAIVAFFELA
jgi:transposase